MKKFVSLLFAALLALLSLAAVPAVAQAPAGEPVPPKVNVSEVAAKTQPWQKQDKGFPDKTGKLKIPGKSLNYARNPKVVEPLPPSGSTVYRNYNIVKEDIAAGQVGVAADLTIAKPYMNYGSEYHGIMEIAMKDASGNTVEVGWTMNPQVCPNIATQAGPCAFVFFWKAGVGQCYNTCGFIPTAAAIPRTSCCCRSIFNRPWRLLQKSSLRDSLIATD